MNFYKNIKYDCKDMYLQQGLNSCYFYYILFNVEIIYNKNINLKDNKKE